MMTLLLDWVTFIFPSREIGDSQLHCLAQETKLIYFHLHSQESFYFHISFNLLKIFAKFYNFLLKGVIFYRGKAKIFSFLIKKPPVSLRKSSIKSLFRQSSYAFCGQQEGKITSSSNSSLIRKHCERTKLLPKKLARQQNYQKR